jgi:mono/diheme cytochrome c family protein
MGRTRMRQGFPAILAAIAASALVAVVVNADLRKGSYHPTDLGSMRQAESPTLSTDSIYQVPAYPVPAVEIAPGEGRREVQIYCNTCHSPRYITMQPPLPAATWEAEVNKMNKAFGAAIPDDETQKIIRYLQANYTPENRKQ